MTEQKITKSLKVGAPVTGTAFYGSFPIVSTAKGAVKVFGGEEVAFTSHAGAVNALALHPSGEILASVGVDKSFVFYDLNEGKAMTQIYADSGMQAFIIELFLVQALLTFDRTQNRSFPSRWPPICSWWR